MPKQLQKTSQLETNKNLIIVKIENYVAEETRYANFLDDETEIELETEQEQEQELELYRPGLVEPCEPQLELDVIQFLRNSYFKKSSNCFMHLPESLKNTSVYKMIQKEAWSPNLYVTKDFFRTVKYEKDDDYLKIPRWMVFSSTDNKIVFISGFELNEFIREFNSEYFSSRLKFCAYMARTRPKQERLFDLNRSSLNISNYNVEEIGVYSGALYLKDEKELEAYLSFLGYCPRPRNEKEERLFEMGFISDIGYVKNDNARLELGLVSCRFKKDPMGIVKKLAEIRNFKLVPDSSHHVQICKNGTKPLL